jgi:hypothetical protein
LRLSGSRMGKQSFCNCFDKSNNLIIELQPL